MTGAAKPRPPLAWIEPLSAKPETPPADPATPSVGLTTASVGLKTASVGPATLAAGPADSPGGRATPPVRRGFGVAGERGGATLIGLGLAGLILLVGVVAVDVGGLVAARAAAQTAADMAALAVLTPRGGPVVPPAARFGEARAADIAAANGAELVACDCSAVQAVVTVRRRVRLAPGTLTVAVTARARAVVAAPPPPPCRSGARC